MNSRLRFAALGASLMSAGLVLSACTANNAGSSQAKDSNTPITVTITDTDCKVSTAEVPSGKTSFVLKNEGTVRNEFEILADDKLRIVGERENLGPGTSVDYTIVLEPGNYFTACKTNMVGALVGVTGFKVSDSGTKVELSADEKEVQEKAVANYLAYVRDQAGQLLSATQEFAAAYEANDIEKAKDLYAPARMHYERIEPTAEAFGDFDPALDEREAVWQEADDKGTREWTGWHKIEKDLWRPEGFAGISDDERKATAKKLVDDTKAFYDAVYKDDFTVSLDDISNGAIGLLEEVATSKITGEEEIFSHTDLYDFKANVEGAEVAYGNVKDLAEKKNPELAKEITDRFTELNDELAKYAQGDGYVGYDTLDDAQRKQLSDKVNALRAPLAKLTEAILS